MHSNNEKIRHLDIFSISVVDNSTGLVLVTDQSCGSGSALGETENYA